MKKRPEPAALTSIQLIELAKQKLAEREPPERRYLPMTDYRFAKLMGFRQQLVSNWRNQRSGIGRQFVRKFAEVTGLPEAYVFACLELERETDAEIRGVLQGLVATLSRHAAGVLLALGVGVGLASPAPANAATGAAARDLTGIYIMRTGRGRRRRRTRRGVRQITARHRRAA